MVYGTILTKGKCFAINMNNFSNEHLKILCESLSSYVQLASKAKCIHNSVNCLAIATFDSSNLV